MHGELYCQALVQVNFGTKAVDTAMPNPRAGKPRITFNNADLPTGTLLRWTKVFLPRWLEVFGAVETPWSLSGRLAPAQTLWDSVFEGNTQVLCVTREPIYAIVRF